MIKSKFSKDEITQTFLSYDVRRGAPLMICYSWRKKAGMEESNIRRPNTIQDSTTELMPANRVYDKKPR